MQAQHVTTIDELSPEQIRAWRPGWHGVPDDRLPSVHEATCSCQAWRSGPSERRATVEAAAFVHRLATALEE